MIRNCINVVRGHKSIWLGGGALALILGFNAVSMAQKAPDKIPLSYEAYDGWRAIAGTQLSRDGKWAAYALTPEDGDSELVVHGFTDGVDHKRARGTAPQFTYDSQNVVFSIKPAKSASDEGSSAPKPGAEDKAPSGIGVMRLADGKVTAVTRVSKFHLPELNGRYLAYIKLPAPKPAVKDEPKLPAASAPPGAPRRAASATAETQAKATEPVAGQLTILDLSSGDKVTIADVVECYWSRDGARLGYIVSSADDAKNGVYIREMADGSTISLGSGKAEYKSFTFDRPGKQAAYLSGTIAKGKPTEYALQYWTQGATHATALVTNKTSGISPGNVVSENGTLRFSHDSKYIYFGVAPMAQPESANLSQRPKVDIWSWKDDYLQSQQKVTAEADRKRTLLSEVTPSDGKTQTLASTEMRTVETPDELDLAIGVAAQPYLKLRSWDADFADYYLIDLKTGAKQKLLEKSRYGATISPAGMYVTYYTGDRRANFARRLRDGKVVNLTAKIRTKLFNEEDDHPEPPAPYGVAGWTANDGSILIYDRFDLWQVWPETGDAQNVTAGAGRALKEVYRYIKLDPEERTIPVGKPFLLTFQNEATKASGYVSLTIAATKTAKPVAPRKLISADKMLNGLIKALAADRYLYTAQTYSEFPDLWAAGSDLSNPSKLSNANPQQSKYIWGKEELIHFNGLGGKPLDAVLIKPDNFDPTLKYPLIINIYEKESQGLHAYHRPAPGTSLSISRYVSNGYVVLLPDIIYKTGKPGDSALQCVLPAIQKVVDQGYIDPQRIGIQGHSWGGYEIAYMVTRTSVFRAAEGGAAVANMTSAYGGIRWGAGISRAGQYEHGQSRMGTTPWENPTAFIANSPIFNVDKITTPFLTIANDADGAVPWYQGIEFITAMRRLGKEAYMFSYNGEDHNLVGRENQKHWTVHMDEFFDHFLLDKPIPDWMSKGVPYLDRAKRDVKPLYQSPKSTAKTSVAAGIEDDSGQ